MKTIEAILLENEQYMIPTYTGKYWGTGTVMEMMREYAKEAVQECISIPSIQYQEQLKENLP